MARRLERLFDRYRRGDARALGRVFDRTAPEVLRVAMHFARNAADAEDLLQETFLTAIQRAATWDRTRPLVPWLLGILENLARNRRRKGKPSSLAEGAPEPAAKPDDGLEGIEWTDAVAREVEGLPDPYREALVLRLRQGLGAAEIAAVLDVAPATVRSRIHRGLELLRTRLSPAWLPAAAIPPGAGLEAVRARVVARAAEALATGGTAVAAATTIGGLLVTKQALGIGVLVLLLAGVGGVLATDAILRSRGPEAARDEATVGRGPESPVPNEAPALVGLEPGPAPEGVGPAPAPAPAGARPPLDAPIPSGKGSVAGRLRFEDGSPVADVPVSLWGESRIVDRTDAEGRFHLHGDWVAERSLYVKEEAWSLILLPVRMAVDELVTVDATIERGVDVESVVVDERSGAPLAGIEVVLRRPQPNVQAGAGFTKTDEHGRFRLRFLPRTAYTLELTGRGYEGVVREVDLSREAWPPRLPMRASRRLEIRLEGLAPEARGTTVSWTLARMQPMLHVNGKDAIDPESRLVVDAPMPGRYQLTIFPASRVPRVEQGIEIPEGEVPPVVVRIPRGARVIGVFVDARGAPVAGARIEFAEGGGDRTTTDAEGRFEIPWAPSGSRAARARRDGPWVVVGRVEVPESGDAAARLVAPGSGSVAGRLLTGGKAPTTAWYAVVSIHDLATSREVAQGNPDAYGRFVFPWLAPGRYEVRGWANEFRPDAREVSVGDGEVDIGDLDLRAHHRVPLRLVLPPGTSLPRVGVTLLLPDGSPAPPVVVGSASWGHSVSLSQGPDGSTWATGVPEGRWRLRVFAQDFAPAEVDVSVPAAGAVPIEVRLERAR